MKNIDVNKYNDYVREWIEDYNEEALLADGFEDAFLGICERYGASPVVTNDYSKCISILMNRDGMTHDEAEEYFNFNVLGAWMGDGTPVYVTLPPSSLPIVPQ